VRGLGLDVHRDFCEIAIAEGGRVRSAGRVATRVPALELFAQSLGPDDVVAMEATTGTDRIVGVLQRHGIRVVVANTRKLKAITEAKAKTDRLDARTLAKLLMTGLLDPVWTPDERTRALRRLTNRRERIVRARTRAKNEAHSVLSRNLCERPPVTDAFGKAGRGWLAGLELPIDERLTLDGCLRQVDFLDGEIAAIDREIAKQALVWPEVLRLMTVPGVNCRPQRRSWPQSVTSTASLRRGNWSATSAWTRESANRATARLVTAGSPRPAPRRRGICSARSPGRS
jgi:transposase